jgi:DNA-binding response OmpR family regulator
MAKLMVVADTPWVINDVQASLSGADTEITLHSNPRTLVEVAATLIPDAIILDMQVGSMGGMALTRALKGAHSTGGLPDIPVLLLLDRRADAFLAKRAAAGDWLLKPFEAHELRTKVAALIRSAEAAAAE